jgi:hypothetical protein
MTLEVMNRRLIAMMDCGSVNNVKVCASYTRARMWSSTERYAKLEDLECSSLAMENIA